jgi:hypothetical protein
MPRAKCLAGDGVELQRRKRTLTRSAATLSRLTGEGRVRASRVLR